jgi:hypothetical protein
MTYTRVTFEATTRVMTLMEAANVLDAEESRLRRLDVPEGERSRNLSRAVGWAHAADELRRMAAAAVPSAVPTDTGCACEHDMGVKGYHEPGCPNWVAAVPIEDGARASAELARAVLSDPDHRRKMEAMVEATATREPVRDDGWLVGPAVPVLPAEPTDAMVEAFLSAENESERETLYRDGRIDQHAAVVAGLRAALAAGGEAK